MRDAARSLLGMLSRRAWGHEARYSEGADSMADLQARAALPCLLACLLVCVYSLFLRMDHAHTDPACPLGRLSWR